MKLVQIEAIKPRTGAKTEPQAIKLKKQTKKTKTLQWFDLPVLATDFFALPSACHCAEYAQQAVCY